MSRFLVFTLALAGLIAVATCWSAGPPMRRVDGPDKPVVSKPPPARPGPGKPADTEKKVNVVELLLKPVNFAGVDDPKETLQGVLDSLSKRYDLPYSVNERAFQTEQLKDVLTTAVAEPGALPPMKTTLGKVLARILARVPVPSGATFLVRGDGVEITTMQAVNAEIATEREQPPAPVKVMPPAGGGGLLGVPPGAPGGGLPGAGAGGLGALGGGLGALGGGLGALGGGIGVGGTGPIPEDEAKKFHVAVVSVDVDDKPFEDAVKQIRAQANTNVVLDPSLGEKKRTPLTVTLLNAPVDSALYTLTEMAELDFVWLDNIFYVTTRDKAERLRKRWPARQSGGTVSPMPPGGAAAGMSRVPTRGLSVVVTGPKAEQVGRVAAYRITVQNKGTKPIKGQVMSELPAPVTFLKASEGATLKGQEVWWSLDSLAGGEERILELTVRSELPGLFRHVVTVIEEGHSGTRTEVQSRCETRFMDDSGL